MIDDRLLNELAGEYVLGTLDGDACTRFEVRLLEDKDAQKAVAEWEARLSPLQDGFPPMEPSDDVWNAVKSKIDGETYSGIITVRENDGEWVELSPGISIKLLNFDPNTKMKSLLMSMEPGSRYPSHHHTGDEECLMLSGEVSFGKLTLRAGDYHMAPKGLTHDEAYSPNGALLFIRAHAA
ncbi:MAG: cupin domain-containing protein [Pseudomonadota bacterium]